MKQYLDLLQDILDNGVESEDRTGTGTLSVFGRQMRFDLSKGFPLLTTKKLHFKSIAIELLWFLSGDTNTKFLTDNGVRIWNEWSVKEDEYREYELSKPARFDLAYKELVPSEFDNAAELQYHLNVLDRDGPLKDEAELWLDGKGIPRTGKIIVRRKGDLGPIYGKQWRFWYGNGGKRHDQIANVIESIKNDPYSRRHIVSAWNVGELELMNLLPCHYTFQFYVREGKLSCMWTQRSNDTFLGNPFNIASYALLTHMIAHLCDLEVGELIFSGGDVHIYKNHIEQVKEQLTRDPRPLPTLKFARKVNDIDDFKFEDFIIEGYVPHPHIAGKVAV